MTTSSSLASLGSRHLARTCSTAQPRPRAPRRHGPPNRSRLELLCERRVDSSPTPGLRRFQEGAHRSPALVSRRRADPEHPARRPTRPTASAPPAAASSPSSSRSSSPPSSGQSAAPTSGASPRTSSASSARSPTTSSSTLTPPSRPRATVRPLPPLARPPRQPKAHARPSLDADLTVDVRDAVGDRLHISDEFKKDGVRPLSPRSAPPSLPPARRADLSPPRPQTTFEIGRARSIKNAHDGQGVSASKMVRDASGKRVFGKTAKVVEDGPACRVRLPLARPPLSRRRD